MKKYQTSACDSTYFTPIQKRILMDHTKIMFKLYQTRNFVILEYDLDVIH